MKTTTSLIQTLEASIVDLWKAETKDTNSQIWKDPKRNIPPGSYLPWIIWKTLYRIRTATGTTASNMKTFQE